MESLSTPAGARFYPLPLDLRYTGRPHAPVSHIPLRRARCGCEWDGAGGAPMYECLTCSESRTRFELRDLVSVGSFIDTILELDR